MRKGYITVYFSIAITICLSLLIGMIYGARENAIRQKTKASVDISMMSAFAEYQKELWEMYDLIFVDSTYGYDVEPIVLSEEHLANCLEKNFDEEKFSLIGGRDFLKINCVEAKTDRIRFFGDFEGQPIRDQAARAMRYKYGFEYVDDLYKKAREAEALTSPNELNESFERAKEKIDAETGVEISDWKRASNEALFTEKSVSTWGTISAVFRDLSVVSPKTLKEEDLFENHARNTGNYDLEYEEETANIILFKEYVLEHFGNILDKKNDSVLDYEVEYCIVGDPQDSKNLEGVLNRILLMREAANAGTLASDTTRMAEIESTAEIISAVLLNPESATAFSSLIFLLWCYAESIADLRALMDGKRVPLIKSPDQWQTGMSAVFGSSVVTENEDSGWCYKDYLRTLLLLEDKGKLTLRASDLMETNIRAKLSNNNFRLDNCFDAWEVTVYVSSEYGYDYVSTRRFDMENY